MARIGIVGHEAAKFTADTQQKAREIIRGLLKLGDVVVSGRCHLGGIDIWAAEEGQAMGLDVVEYAPKIRAWSGGYKDRNIQIAEDSDRVYSLVVTSYPDGYQGMRFKFCYHCGTDSHLKSGGCWTAKYARALGKDAEVIEI